VLETRQHPFAIVGALADALLLLIPAALIVWGLGGVGVLDNDVGTWIGRLLLLFMALVVARLVGHVLEWEFERVIVTNHKVIHIHGVLSRRIASTPLSKVSEFTVSQPLLGRIFDYGSLVVDVPGGREQALHGLSYLPDPAGLYRIIGDRARGEEMTVGGGHRPAPLPYGHGSVAGAAVPSVESTTVVLPPVPRPSEEPPPGSSAG
jgi:hypothetical protein